MTKEKITIKNIKLLLTNKTFYYETYRSYDGEDFEEKNNKSKLKYDQELEDFRKKNVIAYEEEIDEYNAKIRVHYYSGYIEFLPVKENGSSIKMDMKLPKDAINSVAAMCLDSVCDICEKQTKAFQNTFVDFVKENSESLTNQTVKLKESLVARGVNKVLNIGGKNNDK